MSAPQPDPTTARPSITVVPGATRGVEIGAPPESNAPEAQPPVVPPPPQELENDIGGPVLPNPTADEIVGASGGGLGDRMRARFESMASTEEFSVPGWELPNGEPGLIIVAKAFGDRKAYNAGISNEAFIAKSTHQLLYVDDDGSREEIPGGWGRALAELIGVARPERAADLVALVISKPDPANPQRRIPNVAGIGSLAIQIINWSGTATAEIEEQLGE